MTKTLGKFKITQEISKETNIPQNERTSWREKCARESEYFFEKDSILLARIECQLG